MVKYQNNTLKKTLLKMRYIYKRRSSSCLWICFSHFSKLKLFIYSIPSRGHFNNFKISFFLRHSPVVLLPDLLLHFLPYNLSNFHLRPGGCLHIRPILTNCSPDSLPNFAPVLAPLWLQVLLQDHCLCLAGFLEAKKK